MSNNKHLHVKPITDAANFIILYLKSKIKNDASKEREISLCERLDVGFGTKIPICSQKRNKRGTFRTIKA